MRRSFIFLFLLAIAACGGSDEEPTSKCIDEAHEVHATDGTVYCLPASGSGKALCVVEPAEEYNACFTTQCPTNTVLAVTFYPWENGTSENDCNCIPPEQTSECNRVVTPGD